MRLPIPWLRNVAVGLLLTVIVTVVVLAFSWPNVTSQVKDLPVALVGSSSAVEKNMEEIDTALPGVFKFVVVDSRDAAIAAIKQREVYGAILVGASPQILTASAAGPLPSQLLDGIAAARSAPATDIVPFATSDPRGVGLATAAFPLTLGGMLGGIGISILITGAKRRLVALLVYTATSGVALTGILQGFFGALQGSYLMNAAAICLSLLSIGAVIVGFTSLVGRAGVAIGPVLFLLIANPISSANSPTESLIGPFGAIGQLFPPGATATLLRDISYFPDAGTALLWLTQAIWIAAGLSMDLAAALRERTASRATDDSLRVEALDGQALTRAPA